MKLTTTDEKVIGTVRRYFRSLEEMAAYMGIEVDDLIHKIKNQNIHLSLEKKSLFNNSRSQVFKETETNSSPIYNYTAS